MYEIVMLRLYDNEVIPLICNSRHSEDMLEFVSTCKDKDNLIILDLIEANFDCKKADLEEANPLNLKKLNNTLSTNFILYVNYNNGSEQTLFGYPTLKHALIVGSKFLTKDATVKIYKSDASADLWGELKLVETLKYGES